jgi:hypothetical protein
MTITIRWNKRIESWELKIGETVKYVDTIVEVDAVLWGIRAASSPLVTIKVIDRTPHKSFVNS